MDTQPCQYTPERITAQQPYSVWGDSPPIVDKCCICIYTTRLVHPPTLLVSGMRTPGAAKRHTLSQRVERSTLPHELMKRRDQPIYLVSCVVVCQTDAQRPTALLQSQLLHEIQRVVVAVPREDAALAQALGQLTWSVAINRHGNGWHAARQINVTRETMDMDAGKRPQSREQTPRQVALVRLKRREGDVQIQPPPRHAGEEMPIFGHMCASQAGKVAEGAKQPRQAFMILCARLPFLRRLVRRGPHLIRAQVLQQRQAAIENAQMGTEELI